MKIHEQIKEARKAAGLNQTQAAQKTGCTQAYLSKIEAGLKVPTVGVLRKFCQAYDCEIIISK